MTELYPTPLVEKSCVIWSSRRERAIALRVYYNVREEDGCEIYSLYQVQELE